MKAHELAQRLLNGPNLDVMMGDDYGDMLEVNSISSYFFDEEDEERSHYAEGRVGDEVVMLCN
jgi:hypothetical protein